MFVKKYTKKATLQTLALLAICCSSTCSVTKEPKKTWTILTYMAADNDLYPFADRNLEQMCMIGSNRNINILAHLDIRRRDGNTVEYSRHKVTKRLFIRKNKIEQIGKDMCMDSGLAKTLIDAIKWAIDDYPSEHLAICFWNHGWGPVNPMGRVINPSELFFYNPNTNSIELDRSIGFIEYVSQSGTRESTCCRGICFDDSTGHFLDDQKMMQAFRETVQLRGGKKIDLIIFDACLMACAETAHLLAPYTDFMTASQEVALGPGYDYTSVLSAPAADYISPRNFARHIVTSYAQTYDSVTRDYTHSAYDLAIYPSLKTTINALSQALIDALAIDSNHLLLDIIRRSKSKVHCTHFDEPTYIDLKHFCSNLIKNIDDEKSSLKKNPDLHARVKMVKARVNDCIDAIKNLVIHNVAGSNLSKAAGVSIYFPEKNVYPSYPMNEFAKDTSWTNFITLYTKLRKD